MQYILIVIFTLVSCSSNNHTEEGRSENENVIIQEKDSTKIDSLVEFSRNRIRLKIDSIQKVGGDLFVHCLVPLCDNEN